MLLISSWGSATDIAGEETPVNTKLTEDSANGNSNPTEGVLSSSDLELNLEPPVELDANNAAFQGVVELLKQQTERDRERLVLAKVWGEWRTADRINQEEAPEYLEKILVRKYMLGYSNLFHLSKALIRLGGIAKSVKNFDRAMLLADYGIKFSPDLPSAYFFRASVLWSKSKSNAVVAIAELIRGGGAKFRNTNNLIYSAINLAYIFSVSGLILVLLYTLALLKRYLQTLSHDVYHYLPLGISEIQVSTLIVLLLLLPIGFNKGLLLTFTAVLALTIRYQSWKERFVSAAILSAVAALPFATPMLTNLFNYPGSVNESLYTAGVSQADSGLLARVQSSSLYADDPEVLWMLGVLAERGRSHKLALTLYKSALNLKPKDMYLLNNIGNVLFRQGKYDEATQKYIAARDLSENFTDARYNLYRALLQVGKVQAASAEHAFLAEQKSPAITAALELKGDSKQGILLVSHVPRAALLNRFLHPRQSDKIILPMWRLWGGKMQYHSAKTVGLYGLGLMALLALTSLLGKNKPCPSCGDPICEYCQENAKTSLFCTGCTVLKSRPDDIKEHLRTDKKLKILAFQKLNRIVATSFSFVFPGWAQMVRGATLSGIVLAMVFVVCLMQVLTWKGYVRAPFTGQGDVKLLSLLGWGLPLVGCYLFSAFSGLRNSGAIKFIANPQRRY